MPINFFFILFGQVAVLLAVVLLGKRRVLSSREFLISAVAGCVIGLTFDLTLNAREVFVYIGDGASPKYGLSLGQLVLNGIFSYGISVATARYFPFQNKTPSQDLRRGAIVASSVLLVLSGVATYFTEPSSIAAMFVYGMVIICVGELLVLLAGDYGPLWRILANPTVQSIINLWSWIVGIGLFYELVNFIFPFWRWLPASAYGTWYIEGLVVALGYIVLFHPMMIAWQLVDSRK